MPRFVVLPARGAPCSLACVLALPLPDMHIPDGYLGPATAASLYALAIPFWYGAGKKTRQALDDRMLPSMAMLSAFCFVVQMLNFPLPLGTTGHATGAGIAAIVLGVWPAVLCISTTIVIQALFFGDGGITAVGANCFNMAVVQVFCTFAIYRLLSSRVRKPLAGALAAYAGVNTAAFAAGVELGIQPVLAATADGTPLYAPYPLSVAVPAMVIGHLITGLAEAALTGLILGYMARSLPELLEQPSHPETHVPVIPLFWRRLRTLWLLTTALVFLAPLGLLAPGTAWGEWSAEQLRNRGLGFIPSGMKRWEGFWTGLLPDYRITGLPDHVAYLVSAGAGVLLILCIFRVLTAIGQRRDGHHP